jgi:predicted permease
MSQATSGPAFRRLLDGLSLDLRATLRGLRRRPAFSMTAVVTIALGIGASTTMFSVVDSVLLRALPYSTPDRLVALMPGRFYAQRDVDALRRRLTSLDQVTVFSPGWLMPLVEIAEPRQVNAARVGGNLFAMVGARPLVGRVFGMDSEMAGAAPVAVLSWQLWQDVFGGDSSIIDRSIALEGRHVTVIGVMARSFQLFDWKSDLWVPMSMSQTAFTWTGGTGLLYGRLAPGRPVAAVTAELKSVLPGIAREFSYAADWSRATSVVPLQEQMVGNVRRVLWLLFGAVAFLLLIATSNVANLTMVRAAERRAELALRTSLGAPGGRIARLLLGESLLLGITGGALGVLGAIVTIRYLPGFLPRDLPRLGEIELNARILVFALLATVLPSLLFALGPITQSFRAGQADALREARGVHRGERIRGALVAVQVALCLILLIGASVMGRSLSALLTVDRGLRSDHLLTATVQPSGSPEQVRAFWRGALASIDAIPGVSGAATILHLPTIGRSWQAPIDVVGRALAEGEPRPHAGWQSVSTGYFATAGVPLLAGRPFDAGDHANAPPVVAVNRAFATRFFPGETPLGRQVIAGNASAGRPATIIAVVGGVRHDSLSAPPAPELYVPIEQQVVYATGLIVRTSGDPKALVPAVQRRIWDINPNVPLSDIRTMDERFSASLQRPRLILGVLAAFAIAGLTLGAVGIYGVVAYTVQQRWRELGIRSALGAGRGHLQGLVVRGGLRYAVVGIAIGLPIALALSRVLRGMVFGIAAADPASFAAVPVIILVVTMMASWIPSRRGARSDPMTVLREDS